MIKVISGPKCLLEKYRVSEKESECIMSKLHKLISDPSAISNPHRCYKLLDKYEVTLLKSDNILKELNNLTESMESDDPRRSHFKDIVLIKFNELHEKKNTMNKMEDNLSKTITEQADKRKETLETNKRVKTVMYFGYIAMATLAYLISE